MNSTEDLTTDLEQLAGGTVLAGVDSCMGWTFNVEMPDGRVFEVYLDCPTFSVTEAE